MVWGSLESWFDLLQLEVQKLQRQDRKVAASIRDLGKQFLQSQVVGGASGEDIDAGVLSSRDDNPAPFSSSASSDIEIRVRRPSKKSDSGFPSNQSDSESNAHEEGGASSQDPQSPTSSPRKKPPALQLPLAQSSRLAAAIVHTTPLKRRVVFLRASSSCDEPPLSQFSDTALKRRSWHVERVAARYLALGQSFTSLPNFDRSLSSDSATERQSGKRPELCKYRLDTEL